MFLTQNYENHRSARFRVHVGERDEFVIMFLKLNRGRSIMLADLISICPAVFMVFIQKYKNAAVLAKKSSVHAFPAHMKEHGEFIKVVFLKLKEARHYGSQVSFKSAQAGQVCNSNYEKHCSARLSHAHRLGLGRRDTGRFPVGRWVDDCQK